MKFQIKTHQSKLTAKKAYTLAELTIAISVLSLVIIAAMNTFANVLRSRERLVNENLLYSESRLTMEFLARAVRDNVVDFSEYYNQYVVGGQFGENSHYYASRFLDPAEGCDLTDGVNTLNTLTSSEDGYVTNQSDLGLCCYNANTGLYSQASINGSCDGDAEPTSLGQDLWSGSNPYSSDLRFDKNAQDASAFCDNDLTAGSLRRCSDLENPYEQAALYLLSPDGKTKTIFALEKLADIQALSYVELSGEDTDSDAVLDRWTCSESFDCRDKEQILSYPNKIDLDTELHTEANLDDYFLNFVPISSLSINITDLKFYISPLEDPLLAYTEESSNYYPSVTIVMTVELANQSDVTGNLSISLQTTVTPQYREVDSLRIK